MLGQDAHKDFIGREAEIALYEQWLAQSAGPWVLYFHGASAEQDKRGGIGKTWLLQRLADLTQKTYPEKVIVRTDFFNVADRSGIVIAERMVKRLKEQFVKQLKAGNQTWTPEASEAILTEYRNAGSNDTADSTLQKRLANAIASDLAALDGQLQKAGRYLLLFYDTFELIEENPVVALLNPTQKFPDNYQFAHIGVVMAGRNALDFRSYWGGREQEVRQVALGPFSLEDMVKYIRLKEGSMLAKQAADSAAMHALYERTEGRPILIALVEDIVNKNVVTLQALLQVQKEAFAEHLVSLLRNLEGPIQWIVLFMAHVYHRFNASILDWMLEKSDLFKMVAGVKYEDLIQELLTFSFVRRSTTGNDFVLHDEVRLLINRYCWERSDQDPHKESRREISNYMIEYYEKALANEQDQLMRQSYTVEMLYHKFFVDLDKNWQFFDECFKKALTLWSLPYARSLLQEAQEFALLREQCYRSVVLEARLLQQEENPRQALTLYQYLRTDDKTWFERNCSTVYWGLSECFQSLGNFSEAIEYAQKSLEIEQLAGNKQRQAEILGGALGYIYQRLGKYDEAITYYQLSLAIYKESGDRREYADKMNGLGNIYRVQGQIDLALRCCLIALRIREELLREGRASDFPKGLSLSTIGQIYLDNNDVLQAEGYLQEASAIFQRTGHKRDMARTYNRLGRAQEMKGDLDSAMNYFVLAYKTATSVDAQEEQINSLNSQGRVFMCQKQKDLTKAGKCFEQAIELSRQMQASYQEVESLIALAEAFELSGMREEALQALESGREIALERGYYYLLGSAKEKQGMVGYQRQDYDSAFDHFTQSCHYMALFNSVRYQEAVRLLVERLLQIPKNFQPDLITMIRDYWSGNSLDATYPELIDALNELEDLDF